MAKTLKFDSIININIPYKVIYGTYKINTMCLSSNWGCTLGTLYVIKQKIMFLTVIVLLTFNGIV
jgi:hypothetical protein